MTSRDQGSWRRAGQLVVAIEGRADDLMMSTEGIRSHVLVGSLSSVSVVAAW
jgi:hypothetical protein